MSRRRPALALFLSAAGLAALGAGLWMQRERPGGAPPHPLPRGERPVLLVTLDTTRADHLEPYGARDVETPTLRGLAARGVTFERAYSVAPITLVAHTSLHTGLYPPQHGVRNNGIHHVPDAVRTLAERLSAEGYATAAFVSAAVLDHRYGLDQGFEVYDDDLSAGRERRPRMVADRPAEATVTAARAWLDHLDPARRRFFLWVHFYDPHAAYSPPPPYRDRYRERLYDGEIAYMDAQLGRLLAHPRLASPDTLVLVVGDHGESLGEHGEQTHALLAYDSTLHVPWIARIPGVPAGLRVASPVGQVDLVPTLLDLLGMAPDRTLPGNDLVPLLDGRTRVLPHDLYSETYLPFYTYGWGKLRVLRRGGWKWIEGPEPKLFDLSRDPGELSNLASQEPGLAHDLSRDLGEMISRLGPDRESRLALDTESADRLRSLGYLAVGSRRAAAPARRPDPAAMVGLHVALERARTLLSQHLAPQAETELRRVLARDPGNLAALSDLSDALADQGRLDDAVAAAERALALDPSYPRFHLQLAALEARRGNRERALALVDSALGLDPRFTEARLQRAALLRQMGRREEAHRALEEALAASPQDPPTNVSYAQGIEMEAGDLPAAEARLRRALDRDPFLVAAWRLLGQVLERQGRDEEAAEAYGKGLARRPDDADLHARLGLLLARTGGPPETEAHLREALRLSHEARPEVSVALGAWLAEHGRLAEAEAEYSKVLAVEPGNPGARNNRAIALYRTGRTAEAEAELSALVAELPGYGDAQNNLAAIELEKGEWRAAERHARLALEADPRMTEAWNNLGYALQRSGETEAAQKAYRRALETDPDSWQARFNLGVSLARAGRAAEAAEELEAVVRQLPGYAPADLELGDLYRGALADPARARRFYNAFLRLSPRAPRAAEVRRRIAALPPPGAPP